MMKGRDESRALLFWSVFLFSLSIALILFGMFVTVGGELVFGSIAFHKGMCAITELGCFGAGAILGAIGLYLRDRSRAKKPDKAGLTDPEL